MDNTPKEVLEEVVRPLSLASSLPYENEQDEILQPPLVFSSRSSIRSSSGSFGGRVQIGGSPRASVMGFNDYSSDAELELIREAEQRAQSYPDENTYAFERPLDTLKRHSRMTDFSPAYTTPRDQRMSTLPPGLDGLLDPFGFAVNSSSSPYDTAMQYSRRPSPRSASNPNSRYPSSTDVSTQSNITLLSHSTSATSSGPWHPNGDGAVSPPWQKQRSASLGEEERLAYARRSAGYGLQSSLSSDTAAFQRSKLSAEIQAAEPPAPSTSTLPPSLEPVYTSTKLYQRTQKALAKVEKEKAKAASKALANDQPRKSVSRASSFISINDSVKSAKRRTFTSFFSKGDSSIVPLPVVLADGSPSPATLSPIPSPIPSPSDLSSTASLGVEPAASETKPQRASAASHRQSSLTSAQAAAVAESAPRALVPSTSSPSLVSIPKTPLLAANIPLPASPTPTSLSHDSLDRPRTSEPTLSATEPMRPQKSPLRSVVALPVPDLDAANSTDSSTEASSPSDTSFPSAPAVFVAEPFVGKKSSLSSFFGMAKKATSRPISPITPLPVKPASKPTVLESKPSFYSRARKSLAQPMFAGPLPARTAPTAATRRQSIARSVSRGNSISRSPSVSKSRIIKKPAVTASPRSTKSARPKSSFFGSFSRSPSTAHDLAQPPVGEMPPPLPSSRAAPTVLVSYGSAVALAR